MGSLSKDFESWMRRQAFTPNQQMLSKLVVKHSAQGGKSQIVWTRNFDERITLDNLPVLISEVKEAIVNDASGLGGVQRYLVESYHEDAETHTTRFACRIEGYDESLDGENSPDDTEPATKGGLLAQTMRHNEVLMKTFAMSVGTTIQTLQRQNARLMEQNEALQARRTEDFIEVEAARSEQHLRQVELLKEGSKQERIDKAVEKGLMLLPAAINKLAGKEMLPGAVSPENVMLEDLAKSLTPEQFEKIAGVLAPEQQIVMIQWLQAHQAKEEAKPSGGKNGAS